MQGFVNFFFKDMQNEPCILNGHIGTIVNSIYSKSELKILKLVSKNDDGEDNIIIHNMERFFPDVQPHIIQAVSIFYIQQKFCNLQDLLEYYKQKDQECYLFVQKWIFWKKEGAKIDYERGLCIWNWLNSKRLEVYPKIFKEMFDTSNDKFATSKMILSVLKNISTCKHKVFLMLCFKFILRIRPNNISINHNYNAKIKKFDNPSIQLYEHAANAYLLYCAYLHKEYLCVTQKKDFKKKNITTNFKKFKKEWYDWLKNYSNQSLVSQFIDYWDKNNSKYKNLAVWKILMWQTFIDNDTTRSSDIVLKKIKMM